MEKLMKQIMFLAAFLSIAFGAYAYLTERPTSVIGELRAEMKHEAESIRSEKNADIAGIRADITAKVDAASGSILQRLEKIDRQLEKMDDRLYEMQRKQQESSASAGSGWDGG